MSAGSQSQGAARKRSKKPSAAGRLRVRGVGQDYPSRGGTLTVLDDIDLVIEPGQFVCVVGASGSGKSTLLSILAGLTEPTRGTVVMDDTDVRGPGSDRGLVLQSGALFPWRTIAQNVAFGLELVPITAADRRRRVEWYLAAVGLSHLADRLPGELSGGQRQRVAIARALAPRPAVLLLDEPFGALDVQTKEDMQVVLRDIWRRTGTTVVMVTHDVDEAVFLAERVIVFASDPGRVAQDLAVSLPESAAGERDLSVKRTREFMRLRSRLEDLVRAEHQAHLGR